MRSLIWLLSVLALPASAVALLTGWTALTLPVDPQHMSWWAAVLLLGGLAVSAAAPRLGVLALYAAFVLQLVRRRRGAPGGKTSWGPPALASLRLLEDTAETR